MTNTPKLSIIVGVYKTAEPYLKHCVDSILSQSLTDFELILVDDGSPDSCGQICDEYATKDTRGRVIHQQNGGISVARNSGLDVSRGKYITFVDSDDCIVDKNTYLDNIIKMEEDQSIDMLVYPYIFPYYENCASENKFVCSVGYHNNKEKLFSLFITETSSKINHAVWNKIYKRNIFNILRFPEGKIFEDTYIIPDILNLVKTVYCSKNGVYGYRVTQNSIMTSKDSDKKYHDRIIAYSKLLMSALQYKCLQQLCYRIYSNIFFYYLGMVRSYEHKQYDKELISYIDFCASLSFPWRFVLVQSETFKRKLYLCTLKILGYNKLVKLLLKYKKR